MSAQAQATALRELAAPLLARHGADLEDVLIRKAGSRRLVRLIVDHEGGLDLDLVAQISREVSRALDDSTVMGSAAYVLEVSSPGVDRPLTTERHWARALGRLVRVERHDGRSLTARVLSAGEQAAVLDSEGRPVEVAYAEVRRAVVQVELRRIEDTPLDDASDAQEDESDGPGEVGTSSHASGAGAPPTDATTPSTDSPDAPSDLALRKD